jgi:outer membrane biosynthesis protein TonB
MRNNATGTYPSCSLLVFRTSPQNAGSEYIMLGDAVLNGFFA